MLTIREAEAALKSEEVRRILLSTATKDSDAILRFYTQRERMRVWPVRLFQEI